MVVAHGPYASCPMLDSPRTRPPAHPGRRDDDVRMHASPIQAVSASRSTFTRVVALPEVSMSGRQWQGNHRCSLGSWLTLTVVGRWELGITSCHGHDGML